MTRPGNLLTLHSSNPGGASDTYTYDELNRLATVTDASGVTTYNYDAVGNLGGYTYPNGVATSYAYDGQNRLVQMGSAKGGALASYSYSLGPAGNRLTVAELSGRTVGYGYDALYRLTSETVTADPNGHNGTASYLQRQAANPRSGNPVIGSNAKVLKSSLRARHSSPFVFIGLRRPSNSRECQFRAHGGGSFFCGSCARRRNHWSHRGKAQ
jgi:YD repeat-containing protein